MVVPLCKNLRPIGCFDTEKSMLTDKEYKKSKLYTLKIWNYACKIAYKG